MSHYTNISLLLKDETALVESLIELGWTLDQIEMHETPVNLYGFQGDRRKDVANIIVRRRFIGGASNDIGFIRGADGNYTAIISEYDQGWKFGEHWLNNLRQIYGVKVVERQAKLKGMSVKKSVKQDGTIQLVLVKA